MQLQDTAGSEAECSGATADEEGEGEGARSLAGGHVHLRWGMLP